MTTDYARTQKALAGHVLELNRSILVLEARLDDMQEYLEAMNPPGPITVTLAPVFDEAFSDEAPPPPNIDIGEAIAALQVAVDLRRLLETEYGNALRALGVDER